MIGAHNTLSAYKPIKWWARLFKFAYRCQNKTIEQLVAEGITFFDIRVCWNDFEGLGAHGIAEFNVSPWNQISYICKNVEKPIIRLILEKGNELDKELFILAASHAQRQFDNAKFIGGNYKPTWERLIQFPYDDIQDNIIQKVGSMDTKHRWWGAIWPWLYAKIYNKQNLANVDTEKYYLFDFL